MKSLIVGDLHIGNNKDNEIFHKIALDYASWVKEQAEKYDVDRIIQCGDVFHNRSFITLPSLKCAYQFFDKLKDFKVDVISGNHDAWYLDSSEIHSLDLLKQWPNVTIHDTPTLKGDVFYAPWGTERFEPSKILIGHLEFNGYEMSKDKICTKGMNAADIVDKYSLVLSGHFHKPQGRKYGNKILLYVGSGYQLNWGESEQDKYVYVLDHDTLKMEKIKNEISPRFEYIKSEEDYSKIKNNFVCAAVHTDEERENIIKIFAAFTPLKIDTKLVDKITETQKDLTSYKSAIEVEDLLIKYVNDIFVDFTTTDKDSLISLYNTLYKELNE